MEKTKIVVVGGGYGGVHAAKKLHKKFRKRQDVEITLIDRNPFHTLMTELHEVAGARVEPESVRVSFKKIFGGTNVNVVLDKIEKIDFEKKIIQGKLSYEYDYLVLGTGAEPCFFNIPGVEEHSFTLWSYDDALTIRDHTEMMFLKASKETDPDERRRMLTFAIAGAGFTGIEMAGELLERRKTLCRQYGIDEKDVRIIVVEALRNILPVLPKKMQNKAQAYMEKHGIEIHTDCRITSAEKDHFTTNNCDKTETYTFIWTCGVFGSEFGAKLDIEQGHVKRQKTDKYMQSPSYDNVFLTGDMIWFLEDEKPLPQIVETAIQTAEVAAHNVIASIEKTEKKEFKSNYHGHMVSIGGRYGVSHNMGMSLSGIFAMAVKHLINVHYLFGLAGVNAVWGYIKHEFLDIRENRSVLGGHLSAKVPIYWIVCFRMYLGIMWLLQGIKKATDGWLNPENIFIVSTGATPGSDGVSAGTSATVAETWNDAVSAATDGAVEAATAATDAAGAAVSAATSATADAWSAATDAAGAWGEPLIAEPLWIFNWIMDNIIVIAPFFFQASIVVAEIIIGLALIGGMFTFIAAVASIGLSLMFVIGSMTDASIFWYIFGGLIFLGGAGKGLGMDYWVMPWIKKWWNGTRIAKKTYFYLDEPTK